MGEALAWFSPELVAIPDATFEQWYTEKPELARSTASTSTTTCAPARTRCRRPKSGMLALSGNVAQAPGNAITALRNTDITFPTIKDDQGNDVQISEGRVQMLLESNDGRVRRDAAMNLLDTYAQYKNTAAALMTGNIQKDIFYSRARNYNSCLQAALDGENIDTTVYLNLLAVREGQPRAAAQVCRGCARKRWASTRSTPTISAWR